MILEMKAMGFVSKGCFDGKSKKDLEKLVKENLRGKHEKN